MLKRLSVRAIVVGAIMLAALTGYSVAPSEAQNLATSAVNTIAGSQSTKDCGLCVTVLADVSTTTSSSSFTSSHIHIKTVKTVTEKVHQYEIVNKVKVGFSVMPGGLPKAQQGECRWGDFAWSQWRSVSGGLFYAPNGHHGRTHACWDGHNWRQVGGGPGQWNCGNIVVPVGHRPPRHAIIVPRVVGFRTVREFTTVYDKWFKKATSSTSTSTTHTTYSCDTANGWNKTDDGMHCKKCPPPCPPPTTTTTPPPTTTTVVTTTTTTTTSPPPSHWTQVSCTGFEEISGGGTMIVKCDVSDDNGAQISLDAHSNDGNSRVSGINCYSQGGTPSCSGNGQFEFRVTGINSGSTIVYSSVTATATANGVSKTFTSNPFPVDPSSGGF